VWAGADLDSRRTWLTSVLSGWTRAPLLRAASLRMLLPQKLADTGAAQPSTTPAAAPLGGLAGHPEARAALALLGRPPRLLSRKRCASATALPAAEAGYDGEPCSLAAPSVEQVLEIEPMV
jgi:hypothetical protein